MKNNNNPYIPLPYKGLNTTPRYLILLFASACGFCVANVYYTQPLLDIIATDFNISYGSIGIVITMTQVGSALALFLLVPLGDLLNRLYLMIIQLIALCIALILVASSLIPSLMLLGMLIVGMLGTAMTQGLIAYAASTASASERGRVVGAAQGGVVIGLLLARTIAGIVADIAGWRAVYFLSAIIMLLLLITLFKALPKQSHKKPTLSYTQLIYSMYTLLTHEPVLQIRGTIALLMFAAFSIFWTALVLPLSSTPYSFSHTTIGTFGLVGVVGAIAALRAGYWADIGYGQWVTGLALCLLLFSWLPLGFTNHSLWLLVIGIVFLDLAGQAIHVTNQTMIFNTQPEAQSRLVGCYMLFYAIGSGIGSISTTTIYAIAGWTGVCWLGAIVSFSALVFWLCTLKYTPKHPINN